MDDKSTNQHQQMGTTWDTSSSPWAYAAYNYANRNHPSFSQQTYAQQYYNFYSQQMAYNGQMANNMQMPNGMQYQNTMGQHSMANTMVQNPMAHNPMGQMSGYASQSAQTAHTPVKKEQEDASDKKDDASLPPLPPGPPPSLNGKSLPTSSPSLQSTNNNMYYGQPTNTSYPPIKFNVNATAKKINYNQNVISNGLRQFVNSDDNKVQVFNNNMNSGNSKKKRKKNKMNKMSPQQFEATFGSPSITPLPNQPPLPKEVPPPFPPLPPLPKEPAPLPLSAPGTSSKVEPFSTTVKTLEERASAVVNQNSASLPSALLPTPKYSFGSDIWQQTDSWPESLQAYVNRCYGKCVETVDKDQVEIILKGKITRAANDGTLFTRNWDLEPLPSLYSERKLIEIRKKPCTSASDDLGSSLSQPSTSGLGAAKRGRGLSAAMGSRLGGFGRGQRRSRSRSSSPFSRGRRNRSRSDSRSPPRRRKDRRRSSESSSSHSSDDSGRPQLGGKKNHNSRFSPSRKQNDTGLSRRAQKKLNKQENRARRNFVPYTPVVMKPDPVNNERLQKRAARFESSLSEPSTSAAGTPRRRINLSMSFGNVSIHDDSDIDWTTLHIVGTCQDIAKPYFRLTTAPDASAVRPLEVLEKSLEMVKEEWKKTLEYHYVCDQMKSIRQDLTVQGVRNEFTVKVYETHARIAIEKGDHEEFNQCQTQLKMLYHDVASSNCLEFMAYRILYYIFTKNTLDLTTTLASLTATDKANPCIAHALELRSTWSLGNYHRLLKLYRNAPRMGASLVDWFVERERKAALKTMIKSYRAVLPLSFVVQELAFDSSAECLEFLTQFGIIFEDSLQTRIDCKKSVAVLGNL